MEDAKEADKKKELWRARKKMMDYLARRDHSEKEIRQKMRGKFEPEFIDDAIRYGQEQGWLPDDNESQERLAHKFAESLHNQNKGIHYINQSLSKKGLPPIQEDSERELEKARALIENKFSKKDWQDPKIKAKAGRFLASRGFPMDVVRQIVFKRG